jgi:hypothetical protein
VDDNPPFGVGRQRGRRAEEGRDVVAGRERLAQHVATEGPGGT